MNSGSTTIIEYMPKPNRNADTFVHHTIGRPHQAHVDERHVASAARRRPTPRTGSTAATNRPSDARRRPAPVRRPRSRPSSSATSQPESSAAAREVDGARASSRATRARRRTSPRSRSPSSPAGSRTASGSSRWSTIGPASTIPRPPPTPSSVEMPPIAPATRSRGNSSRMMPNASGKTAPPTPWSTRAAIMTADRARERSDERAGRERERARSRACAPCRTCRRGVRAPGSPPTRSAGRR